MVDYNTLILSWVGNIVEFFDEFAVNIIGFRCFWLKTISYCDSAKVVFICDL